MQWEFATERGVGVMTLTGFLGQDATHRFQGAFDWAVARCSGPLVIDMAALRGWNCSGEDAILDATGRLSAGRGPLVVCGLGERGAQVLTTAAALSVIRVFPDLDTAVAALAAS
ncbi:STAS domain-containing protein [Streptomyces sp. CBMA123]|uniref:STAS domain-containing protein n=1 Tax=Streptomyces sp. CBMA123 TaxID=1896313 RepID=UPI001661C166|nr:STAS domain-containing protein [Streptomyces sp. CBMA123]